MISYNGNLFELKQELVVTGSSYNGPQTRHDIGEPGSLTRGKNIQMSTVIFGCRLKCHSRDDVDRYLPGTCIFI